MIPINRNCFIVRPKKPFFDWLNSLFKDERQINSQEENNVYLVREMDSNEEIRAWIEQNYEDIFQNELNDWYTDDSRWPTKRTLVMFQSWFDVEIYSMVLDLDDSEIEKE